MLTKIFAILAVLLTCAPAHAQVGGGLFFKGGASAPPSCSYPLPVGSDTVVASYGLRKLVSGYAGKAVQLQRASDSTTQDIGFNANNCDFDTASAVTFCTATTCTVKKWYDQSGNTADISQATAAKQPVLTFGCLAGYPCLTFSSTSLTSLSGTLASSVTTGTAIAEASLSGLPTGTNSSYLYQIGSGGAGTGLLYSATSAACASIGFGSVTNKATKSCSTNTWYSWIGIQSAASGSVYLNQAIGTNAVAANTIASSNAVTVGAGGALTNLYIDGSMAELILFAPNISSADAITVSTNQQTYW